MGLTDLQMRKIKPKKERFEVSDGDGLSLRVMPSGAKSFVYRYLADGIPRRMTLGIYAPELSQELSDYHIPPAVGKLPFLTLAEARGMHAEARAKVARGIDPGAEKKAALDTRKAAPTFEDFIGEFWEVELKEKKSGPETLRLLQKDIVPAWGKRKVADIKRRDIVLLLDRVRERGLVMGNRVHGALTRLFNFSAERGIIDDSPCTRIRKSVENGRSRVLNDDEIRLLWAALALDSKAIDVYHISKLALKMILLTGQRPGEVCGMTWEEIDGDGFWNIPASRMKNGEPHRVPLTSMAVDVIEAARPYSGDCDFVFRSSFKDRDAMTTRALSRAIIRHWQEIGFQEKFTPHDLRRTLRTRLAELGVSDVVAERVLGHKLQGVLGIYNRHSYDVEKRQALASWEKRLCEILGLS
ncbi:MAG: tyrosine-type recombinase/integrase [Deltaproteobacteria bacterium]|nr:tyrosine-type recombinase/integrase [Deltaproteobacteria bacterium]